MSRQFLYEQKNIAQNNGYSLALLFVQIPKRLAVIMPNNNPGSGTEVGELAKPKKMTPGFVPTNSQVPSVRLKRAIPPHRSEGVSGSLSESIKLTLPNKVSKDPSQYCSVSVDTVVVGGI